MAGYISAGVVPLWLFEDIGISNTDCVLLMGTAPGPERTLLSRMSPAGLTAAPFKSPSSLFYLQTYKNGKTYLY